MRSRAGRRGLGKDARGAPGGNLSGARRCRAPAIPQTDRAGIRPRSGESGRCARRLPGGRRHAGTVEGGSGAAHRDALDAHPHHDPVQRDPAGRQVPGRSARRSAALPGRRPRTGSARPGTGIAAECLVRCRLPRIAAADLELAGGAAGKTDRVRGGACHPVMDRPEESPRFRPPALRLLSSAHAGRTTDFRRGGADRPSGRQRPGTTRRACAIVRPSQGRHGHLLFHFQHPGRAARRIFRQLPAETGDRRPETGFSQARQVRHAVADSGAGQLAAPQSAGAR